MSRLNVSAVFERLRRAYGAGTIEWQTALTVEQVLERVRSSIGRDRLLWPTAGQMKFVGTVRADGFDVRLRKSRVPTLRAVWYLSARVAPASRGTSVGARFRTRGVLPPWAAEAAMFASFAFIVVTTGITFWPLIIVLALGTVPAVSLFLRGEALDRKDMRAFVRALVAAHEERLT